MLCANCCLIFRQFLVKYPCKPNTDTEFKNKDELEEEDELEDEYEFEDEQQLRNEERLEDEDDIEGENELNCEDELENEDDIEDENWPAGEDELNDEDELEDEEDFETKHDRFYTQEFRRKLPWLGHGFDSEATYSYRITHREFLLASEKCHCCHGILLESESRHHSAVSPEEELQIRITWFFDDYSKWRAGVLTATVTFRTDNIFGEFKMQTEAFEEYEYEHDWRPDHKLGLLHLAMTSEPPDSTGSDYTARFVKGCLEDCKLNHKKCRADPLKAPWYPTRLVEVLDDGGARVLETSETTSTPAGPYATLSHCWGTSGIFSSTTKNIHQLKKRIPLQDLPKTFIDAVEFIRKIGISLIWIDSLCIIQDSIEDWRFESKTMLQVYENAECNLAAAVSEDSHGGLFRQRNYTLQPSGWCEVDNNNPYLESPHGAVPLGYFKNAFEQQIGSSRLVTRGWVYQERAASKRIIAFGRDQVFWDCSERLSSDVLPGVGIYLQREDDSDGHLYENHQDTFGMVIPKHVSPVSNIWIRTPLPKQE